MLCCISVSTTDFVSLLHTVPAKVADLHVTEANEYSSALPGHCHKTLEELLS